MFFYMAIVKPAADHPWRKARAHDIAFATSRKLYSSERRVASSKHYACLDSVGGYLRTFRTKNLDRSDRFARWGFDAPGCL